MNPASTESTTRGRFTDPVSALSELATHGFRNAHEATQAIFRLVRELVGLRICVLTRIDLAANTLTVLEAFDGVGLGVTNGMVLAADSMPCACVVRSAAALREYDLDAHPAFRGLPPCAKLGLRAYIGVPLHRSDGTIWGTLAATDTKVLETTEAHVQTLTVLARLATFEYECEEQRRALIEHLATTQLLEEQRVQTARVQAVLEAAATVSHEVNNPLTVLQLRLARLRRRLPADAETLDDLDVALEAADEIHQVTVQLRSVVRPVSTHYLSPGTRMLDLKASLESAGEKDNQSALAPRADLVDASRAPSHARIRAARTDAVSRRPADAAAEHPRRKARATRTK
jgi:signal transduction histidine kinase